MGAVLFGVGVVVVIGLIVVFLVWMRPSTAKLVSTETTEILTLVQQHAEEREAEDRTAQHEHDQDARSEPPSSIV
jgi:hypothetical protein